MDAANAGELASQILVPFQDNRKGSFKDFKSDLVTAFSEAGTELRERRINPFTLYRDSLGSMVVNLKHNDLKAALLDLVVGGLIQAVPAYQKTEFEDFELDRKGFRRITFYRTGIVLEPLSLLATYLVLGYPLPVVNVVNWVGGLLLGKHEDIHEWNHAFDTFVVQQLFTRRLVRDVENAVTLINADIDEPPYEVQTREQLYHRARVIIERTVLADVRDSALERAEEGRKV